MSQCQIKLYKFFLKIEILQVKVLKNEMILS